MVVQNNVCTGPKAKRVKSLKTSLFYKLILDYTYRLEH